MTEFEWQSGHCACVKLQTWCLQFMRVSAVVPMCADIPYVATSRLQASKCTNYLFGSLCLQPVRAQIREEEPRGRETAHKQNGAVLWLQVHIPKKDQGDQERKGKRRKHNREAPCHHGAGKGKGNKVNSDTGAHVRIKTVNCGLSTSQGKGSTVLGQSCGLCC